MLTAGPRDWQMIYKRGGSIFYTGWIMPRASSTPAIDATGSIRLLAKDRLLSLYDQDYLDSSGDFFTGTASVAEVITEILTHTGLSLDFNESTLWAPDAETGDPLDVNVDRAGFSEQSLTGGPRQALSRGRVLESLLLGAGLSLGQYDGEWHAHSAQAFITASTVTVRTYNTSGTLTGTDTPSAHQTPSETFGSHEFTGTEPVKRCRATYAFGPMDVGDIENGSLDLPSSNFPDNTPLAWSPSGGTTAVDYRRYQAATLNDEHLSGINGIFQAYGIREETVASGSAPGGQTHREGCTKFLTQDIGDFAAGTDGVSISFQFAGLTFNDNTNDLRLQANKIRQSEAFWRVKYVVSGSTYYYRQSTAAWVLNASFPNDGEKRIRMSGVTNDLGLITRLGTEPIEETLTLPATPGAAVGTMTIELGCPVRILLGAVDFNANHKVWCVYDNVTIQRATDLHGASQSYIVEADDVDEGLRPAFELLNGDGPTDGAPRPYYLSNGTTQADDWERSAGQTEMPHTQLVSTEWIRAFRKSQRVFNATWTTDQSMSPVRAVIFDSVRYWPSLVRIERPSGRTTLSARQLLDGGVLDMTTTVESSTGVSQTLDPQVAVIAGEAGPGFPRGGRRFNPTPVYQDRTPSRIAAFLDRLVTQEEDNYEERHVTKTTAVITAGAGKTSASITAVAANTWLDNSTFKIVDINTYKQMTLTANGNYNGSTTLTFDSATFDRDFGVGSWVFRDNNTRTQLWTAEGGLRIHEDEGIYILSSGSKSNGRALQFVDSLTAVTEEYLTLWTDFDDLASYIESDQSDIIIRTNAPSAGGGGTPAITLAAGGEITINGTNINFGDKITFSSLDTDTYMERVAANEVDFVAGGNVKQTWQTDRIDLYGQTNIKLESGEAQLLLDERTGDPAAVSTGIFVYAKTDNRLYFQVNNPGDVHQIFTDLDLQSNVEFGARIGFTGDSNTYIDHVGADEVNMLAGGKVKITWHADRVDLYGQINVKLESGLAQILFDERTGDPAAVSQGIFLYAKTDNRLYYQVNNPADVHKIFTDQDLLAAVTFTDDVTINGDLHLDSTGALELPTGTTAQRPGSPVVGMLRFNTTIDSLEIYASGGWEEVQHS